MDKRGMGHARSNLNRDENIFCSFIYNLHVNHCFKIYSISVLLKCFIKNKSFSEKCNPNWILAHDLTIISGILTYLSYASL